MLPSSPSTSRGAALPVPLPSVGKHPLEIEVYLDRLLEYLNEPDLIRKVRAVCKTWKDSIEKKWKHVSESFILTQDDFKHKNKPKGARKLSQFLQMQQTDDYMKKNPPCNLILHNWNITRDHFWPENRADGDINRRFWTTHGKHIKILTVQGGVVDFINETPMRESLLAVAPNLQRLTFQNCKFTIPAAEGEEPEASNEDNQQIICKTYSRWELNHHRRFLADRPVRDLLLRRPVAERERLRALREAERQLNRANEGEMDTQQLIHTKLKFICFDNVEFLNHPQQLPWANLLSVLRNLEEICVKRARWVVEQFFAVLALDSTAVPEQLKRLDILNMDENATQKCPQFLLNHRCWRQLYLHKLTLDCGIDTAWTHLESILNSQSKTLQTLHLYRAPFNTAYAGLPCLFKMPYLTELRIWGNVSANLNFLRLTPNLRILKWNATCYTEVNHGLRLHQELKRQPSSVFVKNIVENSNQLAAEFKLDSLTTLEIEWGPISVKSWQKLESWMPNLTNLKGVVSDMQFGLIGTQWPKLELLELAHGSTVSANTIIKVLHAEKAYLNLYSFIWKRCPCPNDAGNNESEQIFARSELRKRVKGTVVLPWKRCRSLEQQACVQHLFEQGVINGYCDNSSFFAALVQQINK